MHPRVRLTNELIGLLVTIGAETVRAAWTAPVDRAPKRLKPYKTLRPGPATPLWHLCCELLRSELCPYGAKVRLARHLGIP